MVILEHAHTHSASQRRMYDFPFSIFCALGSSCRLRFCQRLYIFPSTVSKENKLSSCFYFVVNFILFAGFSVCEEQRREDEPFPSFTWPFFVRSVYRIFIPFHLNEVVARHSSPNSAPRRPPRRKTICCRIVISHFLPKMHWILKSFLCIFQLPYFIAGMKAKRSANAKTHPKLEQFHFRSWLICLFARVAHFIFVQLQLVLALAIFRFILLVPLCAFPINSNHFNIEKKLDKNGCIAKI